MSTRKQYTGGPFAEVASASNECLRDMVDLALAFRVSRDSDQVWACCRLHRALSGYRHLGLAEYLSGAAFVPYVSNGDELDFGSLQVHAGDFLAANVEY